MFCNANIEQMKLNLQKNKGIFYKINEILDLYQGNTMRNGKVLELLTFHTAHG